MSRNLLTRGGSRSFLPLTVTVALAFANTASAASGADNGFGYAWADDLAPGGPAYSWYPMGATTLPTTSECDDCQDVVALPFTFTYYGVNYNSMNVSSNGYITFGSAATAYTNGDLSTAAPESIYAWWDDLYSAGHPDDWVRVNTIGSVGSRVEVISWDNIHHISSAGTSGATFQIVLFESTNDILVQYADTAMENATYDNGLSATVGIDQGPTYYAQYSFNTASLGANRAIRYRPPAMSVANGPYTGNEGSPVTLSSVGSTGVSFSWDCTADGTYDVTTTVNSASCTYVNQGSYTARLRATDSAGVTALSTATVTVSNVAPVITGVTVPATGNEGSSVAVSATATDVGTADVLTYTWNWGDATPNSIGASTSHTYMDNGTYTVTLTVTDGDGGSASTTRSVVISNVNPSITAVTAPTPVNEGASTTFSATVTDPAGVNDPITYAWSWGDATPNGSGVSATHSYGDNGTYTVTLTVTDGDGGSASTTRSVVVNNVSPSITGVTAPTPVDEGASTAFSATATDPAGANDPLTYTWSWGDASPNSTGVAPTHTYLDNGTYTVTLTVTDGDGGSTSSTRSVVVNNLNPTITGVTAPTPINEGASTTFSATVTDPAGVNDPITYAWSWGDATPNGSGVSTTHSYANNGTYTVTLTVTDGDGGSASTTRSVVVNNLNPVITGATVPATGNEGSSVAVSATATDVGTADVLTYTWNWGDATPNSIGASTSHTYGDNGTYTVTLTVTDGDGGSASTTRSVVISNVNPSITAVTAPTPVNEGSSTSFSATATDPAGANDPLTYTWSWGDATPNGSGVSTSHTYGDNGTYTVTLTVTDGDGGSASTTRSVVVNNVSPSITGVTAPTPVDEGASTAFSATATDPAGANDPLTYTWSWGDASPNSTGVAPTHTYGDNGTYTVTLTVTDGDGGSTSSTRSVVVNNLNPTITGVTAPTPINEGASTTFSATVTDPAGVNDPITYAWSWGDATPNGSGVSTTHSYADNGSYTVTLTVTDGDGGSASSTRTVVVNNVAPVVATMTVPATADEGSAFVTTGGATDAGTADTHTFLWNWGDGSGNTTGASSGHTYANNGTYTVTLTATDDDGASASRTASITVANVAPTLGTVTYPAPGVEGDTLTFSATATDPGSDTLSYSWNFGDGNNAIGSTVTHVYADNGSYVVTVVASDPDGGADNDQGTVAPINGDPSITSTAASTGQEGVLYTYAATFTDPGSADVMTWSLTGNAPSGLVLNPATGVITWTPTYADSIVRVFNFDLRVTDDDGGTSNQTFTVTIAFTDADADGMADTWETMNGLDPTNGSDATGDPDADGVTSLDEYLAGTDPHVFGGPSQPTPVSPVNGDEVFDLFPTLLALNATDPDGDPLTYEFEVHDDVGLIEAGPEIAEDALGSTGWTMTSQLSENATPWWRARASDGHVWGAWSEPADFRVNALDEPPSAPECWAPIDDAVVGGVRPGLQWTRSVDPDADLFTYSVRISDSDGLVLERANIEPVLTDLLDSWTVDQDLPSNVRYTWTVWATDQDGLESAKAAPETFDVWDGEPPVEVLILAPEEGADVTSLSPTVDVSEARFHDTMALEYTIELDTAVTFDSADLETNLVDATGTGTVSWDLAADGVTLSENTWWYARAQARDPSTGVVSDWDMVHFFVAGLNDPPTTPDLYAPDDGASLEGALSLVVSDSTDPEDDAITYVFRVSSDAAGTDVLATSDPVTEDTGPDSGPGLTGWALPSDLRGTVYWSAQAVDDGGGVSDFATPRELVIGGGDTGTPDTGDDIGTDTHGGCGCGSCDQTGGTSTSWLLALSLGAVARARRRS